MYRFIKIFCLAILFSFSFNANADFNKGLEAYDTGNYDEAFKQWLESAESGDLAAQRNIGQLYRWGRGVEKSQEKAFYWYKKASDKGFHEAQYSLALMYLSGEGTEVNEKEGVNLLKKAAKKGSYNAERKLIEIADIVEQIEAGDKEQVKEIVALKEIEKPVAVVPLRSNPINSEKESSRIAFKSPVENKVTPRLAKEENVVEKEIKKETKKEGFGVREDVNPVQKNKAEVKKVQENITKTDSKKANLNAHLASYHEASKANAGIEEISKKFKLVRNLKTSLKYVFLKEKGEVIRLYVSGNADEIKSLCAEMTKAKYYCKIEK